MEHYKYNPIFVSVINPFDFTNKHTHYFLGNVSTRIHTALRNCSYDKKKNKIEFASSEDKDMIKNLSKKIILK